MDFWPYDSFFDDDDDEWESDIPIDASFLNDFKKWYDKKVNHGSDFSYSDLKKIHRVLNYCIENEYFQDALKYCNTLLEYNPTSSELLVSKGYILMNLRDFSNATKVLQMALDINPNDTDALNNLSLTYYRMGEYDKSLDLVERVLSIEPSDETLYNKGIILQSYQRFEEALDVFKSLLNSQNFRTLALQEISNILFLQGKFEESLEVNLEVLKEEPDNYWLWFNLGLCYMELGRFYKAIDSFMNSLAIYPNFEYSYLYLGWAYSNVGRYKQAIYSFLKYSNFDYDKDTFFEIGNILGDIGFYSQAVKFYRKIIEEDYTFAPAHIGLALCYKHLGKHDKAEEYFRTGVSLDPKNSEFWLFAIKHLIEIRKIRKALSVFSTALSNNPSSEELLLNFHIFVYKFKKFNEAIEILEGIKPLVPNNSTVLFYLGEFYAKVGKVNKAIEYFTESIYLNQNLYKRLKSIMHLIVKKKDFPLFEKMLNLKLSSQELRFNKP